MAVRLGVLDLRLLAIIQSAALFALPAALYHFAMARVRGDALLLAIVLAIVASVYLPTSFPTIGEYNGSLRCRDGRDGCWSVLHRSRLYSG